MVKDFNFDAMVGEEQDLKRQMQASFWAILFLISEQSLAFMTLAQKLGEKGVLDKEDEDAMNAVIRSSKHLQSMYGVTERAFRERFDRVVYALEHPGEVQTPDKTDYPVSTTVG